MQTTVSTEKRFKRRPTSMTRLCGPAIRSSNRTLMILAPTRFPASRPTFQAAGSHCASSFLSPSGRVRVSVPSACAPRDASHTLG